MDDDTSKLILEITLGLDFLLREELLGVLLHIKMLWDVAFVINLLFGHGIQVELESFEHEDKILRETFEAHPLKSNYLLVTLVAMVRIIAF
jgi:hypothetical protein